MILLDDTAPATLAGVSTLRRALRRCLAELRLPEGAGDDLQLAVAELGTNIVTHGCPAAQSLRLRLAVERHLLRVEIEDDGAPFEKFHERLRNASSAEGSARTSGMGLDFIRTSVDSLHYWPGSPNRTVLMRRLHGRKPRILLIEDDPVLREVYGVMLARHFEPVMAGSLSEARGLVDHAPPDLVVADLHLGDGKGNEAGAWFEQLGRQLPVPLLILTGDRRPAIRSSLMRDGVDAVMTKPVSARDLVAAVRGALARSARQQTAVLSGFGSILERVTVSLPDVAAADWRIGHARSPAGLGGGDVALVLAGTDRTRVVLADVMGHGLLARASALAFAGALRAAHVLSAGSPAAFLSALNAVMFEDPALGGIFATIQVIDLLPESRLCLASAGHPEPWLLDRQGVARRIEIDGVAPGLIKSAIYQSVEFELARGERLLLMTDGLDPADLSGGGRLPDWLRDAFAGAMPLSTSEAAGSIGAAIERQLMPEQIDDWTIVLLEAIEAPPARR